MQLAMVTLLCLLHISNLSVDDLCCHGFCTCSAHSGRARSHQNCVAKTAVPKLSLFFDNKPCPASSSPLLSLSLPTRPSHLAHNHSLHPTSSMIHLICAPLVSFTSSLNLYVCSRGQFRRTSLWKKIYLTVYYAPF